MTWGAAIEPRLILDERTFDAVLPHCFAFDGMRVAMIADVQMA